MALTLYRRHRPKCEASAHHPEGSRTAEFQERLKGYKGRARKNGNHVFAWVPDFVRDRLIRRAKLHGQRPFIVGRSDRLETVTNVWRRRLEHAFDAAGPFEQRPTPHRFRHTFARKLLQRGVPVPDVADLMGDTEQVVRRSYAAWVPERQDRLTKILQDTFSDKPKLTAVRGGRL